MKKKKSKKQLQENPNQLSFDFFYREEPISVHIPKSANTTFNSNYRTNKRLSIRLAES